MPYLHVKGTVADKLDIGGSRGRGIKGAEDGGSAWFDVKVTEFEFSYKKVYAYFMVKTYWFHWQ